MSSTSLVKRIGFTPSSWLIPERRKFSTNAHGNGSAIAPITSNSKCARRCHLNSPWSCAPTRSKVSISSPTSPSTISADCWPMTWAWVRLPKASPGCSGSATAPARRKSPPVPKQPSRHRPSLPRWSLHRNPCSMSGPMSAGNSPRTCAFRSCGTRTTSSRRSSARRSMCWS